MALPPAHLAYHCIEDCPAVREVGPAVSIQRRNSDSNLKPGGQQPSQWSVDSSRSLLRQSSRPTRAEREVLLRTKGSVAAGISPRQCDETPNHGHGSLPSCTIATPKSRKQSIPSPSLFPPMYASQMAPQSSGLQRTHCPSYPRESQIRFPNWPSVPRSRSPHSWTQNLDDDDCRPTLTLPAFHPRAGHWAHNQGDREQRSSTDLAVGLPFTNPTESRECMVGDCAIS
eukprot:GGOE01030643.1.p2 GENE.GGOE01030643.1~~GGOE01030643.1.p2  ORF type:complete len:228 (+),score=9.58 GGOE01030643.1:573-1256(+)